MNARALLALILAPHIQLTEGEAEALAVPFRAVHYERGEVLFRAGDTCHEMVILNTGLIRSYYEDEQGRDVNLRFLASPNLATAMSSLITGEPSREWVAAVTESSGFRASAAALRECSPRTERLMRILAEQHYLSMEQRLRMLQHRHVRERYAFYRAQMDESIVNAMPDFHVASYLGVAPETLSRAKRARPRKSDGARRS